MGVLAGALQGARVDVGGHDAVDPPAGQERREHPRPRAEVERGAVGGTVLHRHGKWSVGDQVDVLAPDRGEHAIVRVDASVQGRDLHALLAPLVRPDHAEQLRQGDHRRFVCGPVGLGARPTYVGGSAQGQGVVGLQQDEEPAQDSGTVTAGPSLQVEGLGRIVAGPDRFPVDATAHRLEKPTGVVEVAAPQQCRALAGQAVGGVGFRTVVRDDDTVVGRDVALGVPAGGSRGVGFGPVDGGHRVLLVFGRARARRALRQWEGRRPGHTTGVVIGEGGSIAPASKRERRSRREPCRSSRRALS